VEEAYTTASLAINVAAFCAAAVCLHLLGQRMLGSAVTSKQRKSGADSAEASRAADMAALIFCCNPASVFYSAAYSEALFAAFTWSGLLLLPSYHWAGVAALTAAAAARSNGVLGAWFPIHKLLVAWRALGRFPWGDAMKCTLSCCAILAPYIGMQGGCAANNSCGCANMSLGLCFLLER
jgi:phosphatidylinositol glycan class V